MTPQSNGTPIPTCDPDSYLTPPFDCQSWSTMNPSEQMPIPLSYLLPIRGGSKFRTVALPQNSTSPASPTTSPDSEGTENLNRPQPLFPSVGLLHPSSTWIPGSARRTWEQQPRVSLSVLFHHTENETSLSFSIVGSPGPPPTLNAPSPSGHWPPDCGSCSLLG